MNVVICLFQVGKTLSLYTSITIRITQMDLICLYKANDYYLQKLLLQTEMLQYKIFWWDTHSVFICLAVVRTREYFHFNG